MKRLSIIIGLLFLVAVFVSFPVQAEPLQQASPSEDTFTLIERAHGRGEISLEQATFFRLYALFGDERLPARFRSQVRPKADGTALMIRTLAELPRLSKETQQAVVSYYTPVKPSAQVTATPANTPIPTPSVSNYELRKFRDVLFKPQVQFNSLIESQHFAVYYDARATIPSANGNDEPNPHYTSPANAQNAVDRLEFAWNAEMGNLGFRPPKPARYEVYLLKLRYGGAITPSRNLGDGSSLMFLDTTTVVAVPSEVSNATVHELNHASQYTYKNDIGVALWYMEATAKWVEYAVLGDIDSWKASVVNYFAFPENGFAAYPSDEMGKIYGIALFPKYLQEKYGTNIIRSSWEEISRTTQSPYATYALDSILRANGSNLPSTFNAFTQANYLKVYPANGSLWPNGFVWSNDASLFMEVKLPSIGNPASGKQSNQPDRRIGPLGVRYLTFSDADLVPQLATRGATDGASLQVHFAFEPGTPLSTSRVTFYKVTDVNNLATAEEIPALPSGNGNIYDFRVNNFGKTYHQVVAVIANTSWNTQDTNSYIPQLQYSYQADVLAMSVNISADKNTVYNKGESATFSVSIKNAYQQLFDPQKLSATLSTPTVTGTVTLTRLNTGMYSYPIYYLYPGTYTLTVAAADQGDKAQAQLSINVQRILWLTNGNQCPPCYYIPGIPYHFFVTYNQRDNVPPAYVRVYVQACSYATGLCQPEIPYDMQQADASDTNYADGAQFIFDMSTDPTGSVSYNFHFQASDGTRTVSGEDPAISATGTTTTAPTQPSKKNIQPKR